MELFKSWEELSRKEQLESIFWDAYKDAHGFRPRHIDVSAMTEAQLEAELDSLGKIIGQQEAQRKEDEHWAIVLFNNRVEELIKTGAKDRETAIRWIHEAEDTRGDDEYLCYCLGLPYGFFKKP
jgi:hypothetical protein